MDGVRKYEGNESIAVLAVKAGNDMLISSDFVEQKKEIITAIQNGKLEKEKINQAVVRILAWKMQYAILEY